MGSSRECDQNDRDRPRLRTLHAVHLRWLAILERGGTLIGAFDAETLAAFAIYRPRLAEGLANLSALYVSRSHRRRGVALLLTGEFVRLARADGAERLYVFATPSGSAVGFYRGYGFELAGEPTPELFALEPDDIHPDPRALRGATPHNGHA